MKDWWAKETAEQFVEKAQCVVDQFGNFTVEQVNLNLNGINTQGENIADMGGLVPAYEGYGKLLDSFFIVCRNRIIVGASIIILETILVTNIVYPLRF